MPAFVPLIIPQGSTLAFGFYAKIDETPITLNGWSGRGQVRAYAESPDIIFQFLPEEITITPDSGWVDVQVPASRTLFEPLPTFSGTLTCGGRQYPRLGVWDFELFNDDGDVVRVIQGPAALNLEVTR